MNRLFVSTKPLQVDFAAPRRRGGHEERAERTRKHASTHRGGSRSIRGCCGFNLELLGSIGLACFVFACGGSGSNQQQEGVGGSVSNSGGNTAGPKGGSQTGPNSGSTQPVSTGGSGTASGGGDPSGPAGGTASSNQTGNTATGGSTAMGGTGSAQGGAVGSSKGGNAATGGSSGSAKGGNTGVGGSITRGGGSGVGSSSSAGSPIGNGGAPKGGSGGATTGGTSGTTSPPAEPKLVTSAQSAYWKTDGVITEVTSGTADVTVNDTSAAQTWDGFGGTFNEAGWNVLTMLSQADQDFAMNLLFGPDGARFAYGRVPIGASDYALDRYTLDENPGDYTMDKFSIERDRKDLIPYIQAALALKPDLHLWASPWTPPTWMKDNGAMDGGNMKDDAKILQAHALYLAKFVEEYQKEQITIEAIHPQNEPGYETRYPSCLWTAALMTKFIGTYLGPTFADRKVGAAIYLGTMSNADAGKDGTIISTVTGDATAMKYVKGFGLQWNMIDSVSSLKSRNLPMVQSEHKCGNYPWNPSGFPAFNPDKPPNDHAYAVESWGLIRDWIKAGVNSYSAWNMVLDTAGKNLDPQRPWPQNALLTVDTSAKKLIITPAYYVFRHFSQFVDPGAKVVGTTGGDAIAFKNTDGTIVAVVYNSGSAKKSIVAVGGKKLQFDLPGNGWATINWKN